MSKALYFSGDEDSFETAYFINKIDKFFDTLLCHHLTKESTNGSHSVSHLGVPMILE